MTNPQTTWQPIETIPEKKTVDVWSKSYGRVADCRFMAGQILDGSFHTRRIIDATHWMEIPDAP